MSEPSAIEEEQQAPVLREAEAGPLLPRWFIVTFYVVFSVFSVYSIIHITRSLTIQHALTGAVDVVNGAVDRPAADLDSPEGQKALAVLKRHSSRALLYLNQALLQNEENDPRMARAMALRKAADWGRTSARRDVIGRIVEKMTDEGVLAGDFTVDEEMQQVLEEMVVERRAAEMTYVEDRITDVLDWLAEGYPGQPTGPEKRRLSALKKQLAKKVFVGAEAKALEALMAQWRGDSNAAAREAAEAFDDMLAGQRAQLSPEATALCVERADQWEQRYRDGMIRIAQAGRQMAAEIGRSGRFLDHPHIYQYLSLLDHRFDEVRREANRGAWELRHSRFAFLFVSYFASKTAINPSMAVETVRLTREEHEREMREANVRRMREAVALLGRLGVDYVQDRDSYQLRVGKRDDFVRKHVVGKLHELADEELIADLVEKALADIRRADVARPGGPLFFAASGG